LKRNLLSKRTLDEKLASGVNVKDEQAGDGFNVELDNFIGWFA
jgi:hypothetical protein